jgi:hypothetical protein
MFFYYVIALNLLFGKGAIIPRAIFFILMLIGVGAMVGFHRPVLILIAHPIAVAAVGCAMYSFVERPITQSITRGYQQAEMLRQPAIPRLRA